MDKQTYDEFVAAHEAGRHLTVEWWAKPAPSGGGCPLCMTLQAH
jgi:hypothetical protein